ASSLALQEGRRLAQREEIADQVHVGDPSKGGRVGLVDRSDVRDTRVQHENVDPSVEPAGGGESAGDRALAGDVEHDPCRETGSARIELPNRSIEAVPGEVGQHDVRARLDQLLRYGEADRARPAR